MLQRLVSMPMMEWQYIKDEQDRRHIGPTTEDFHQAFGLGTKGRNIIPLDVQGVTVAALQGLNKKVVELESERDQLKLEIEELKKTVAALVKSAEQ